MNGCPASWGVQHAGQRVRLGVGETSAWLRIHLLRGHIVAKAQLLLLASHTNLRLMVEGAVRTYSLSVASVGGGESKCR